MKEVKEIEFLPPKYYPLLNDYIRIGKRLLSQKKLVDKKEQELDEAKQNLYKLFDGKDFGIFKFKILEYYGDKLLILSYLASDAESDAKDISWTIDFEDKTFEEAFLEPSENFLATSKHYHSMNSFDEEKKYKDDYDELHRVIKEMKRLTAFNFFLYKKLEESLNKIWKAFNNKKGEQSDRYMKLKEMWVIDHRPTVGQPVIYYTTDYREKRKGTITKITNSHIYIKSSAGKTISRLSHAIQWPEKFSETAFSFAMSELQYYVPECWKEKRLDYYV